MPVRRERTLERISRDAELRDEITSQFADNPDAGREAAASAPHPPVAGTVDPAGVAVASASPDDVTNVLEGRTPPPPPDDGIGLEAIIHKKGRPVLNIRNDAFDPSDADTETWRNRLAQFQRPITSAIRSVGRIEVRNNPSLDWVGTGWRVAEDIIVTNRHVAQAFAHASDDGFVFAAAFPDGVMAASIDFREEHEGAGPAEFELVEVLHIEDHPGPDMAFLRIDWTTGADPDDRAILSLVADPEVDQRIVVIGYPAKDTRTRIPEDMDRIFGDIYNVKRLAPGEVDAIFDRVSSFAHDATTLGGNSGSVVLDMATGTPVGLHFAGKEESANYAVLASVVRQQLDRIARIRMSPPPPPAGSPPDAGPVADAAPAATPRQAPSSDAGATPVAAGRTGYDPGFLDVAVPLPGLSEGLAATVPEVDGSDNGLLDYIHYSVLMNTDRKLATYTACNIDGTQARNVRRARDKWFFDDRLDHAHQVGNDSYKKNKLDRGHLVRRLDPAWGKTFADAAAAADDTFYYTNCAPQHERLNRRTWLGLEDYILSNTNARDLKVSVFTGPVFRDDDRKHRDFAVPEDFWKVVAMVQETGDLSVTAYMITQRDFMDDLEFAFAQHETFQVSVAEVERQTGLDFGSLREQDPLATRESRSFVPLASLDQIVL